MRFLVLIGALVLFLSAPGAGNADPGKPDRIVTIDNFVFTPPTVTIPAGTRVVWINRDDIPHTVTSPSGQQVFGSPPLDTDDRFSVVFDRPGIYRYFCSIHPMMTGTVVVQ